jgi:hypothetical protein
MFVETKTDGEAPIKNKWRDSLLKAIEILDQFGWCQGNVHNDKGEHCLLGALFVARYGEEPTGGPLSSVRHFDWSESFKIMKPHTGKHIAYWNDEGGRTKDEVVAALRAAAATYQ